MEGSAALPWRAMPPAKKPHSSEALVSEDEVDFEANADARAKLRRTVSAVRLGVARATRQATELSPLPKPPPRSSPHASLSSPAVGPDVTSSDAQPSAGGDAGSRRRSLTTLSGPGASRAVKHMRDCGIGGWVQTAEDAVLVLERLRRRFAVEFPGAHGLAPCSSSPPCRCASLFPSLDRLRRKPIVQQNAEVLSALDAAIQEGGVRSRAEAQRRGLHISNRRWRRARHGDAVKVRKGGRPSKVDNPENVDLVREVAMLHSQETSDFVSVVNPRTGAREAVFARALSTTRYDMYLSAPSVLAAMSFQVFLLVLRRWFPEVRKARKKTDYCDHCQLHRASILPGWWEFVREAREALIAVLPTYFEAFDDNPRNLRRQREDVVKFARAFWVWVARHGETRRQEREAALTLAQRAALHAKEAEVEDRLRWEVKVLKAYAWHRRRFMLLEAFA